MIERRAPDPRFEPLDVVSDRVDPRLLVGGDLVILHLRADADLVNLHVWVGDRMELADQLAHLDASVDDLGVAKRTLVLVQHAHSEAHARVCLRVLGECGFDVHGAVCSIFKAEMGKQSRIKRACRAAALGDSKRREDIDGWVAALDEKQFAVVKVARAFIDVLAPSEGACYRCSFFLRLFLRERYGLDGRAVVGFVNDGTDEVYPSHAWYEFHGQRTDLAISRPLRPDVQPRGPLVIQGIEFQPGHAWTYHHERPAAGTLLVAQAIESGDPVFSQLFKEQEERTRPVNTGGFG